MTKLSTKPTNLKNLSPSLRQKLHGISRNFDQQFDELWNLDDEELFLTIKRDVAIDGISSFVSLTKSSLAQHLALNVDWLVFCAKVATLKKSENFKTIAFKYFKNFDADLREVLCKGLNYCENKKKAGNFKEFAKVAFGATIPIFVHHIPVSLFIYLLKKYLDKLCQCKD